MKRNLFKLLYVLMAVFSLSSAAYAQTTVSGTVTGDDGLGVPRATVVQKGTANGTVTNIDGKYTLTVPDDAVIVYSFVGMKTIEEEVGGRSTIDVKLTTSEVGLDEVVVVGYGIQKKVHLTASVTEVEAEVIQNRPVGNSMQALQGTVPNLSITTSNRGGEPGASMNMNIRGLVQTGTNWKGEPVVTSASPLVIVDGVQLDMNAIDPEDIQSVSVLKDAAAASIYGARAAGGAIVITTKSGAGSKGNMNISYSNNFGWAQPTYWQEQVDAHTFALVWNDAQKNTNGKTVYNEEKLGWILQNMEEPGSAPTMVLNASGTGWAQKQMGVGATGSTDWKDYLFKDWAMRQKHNLTFRGGDAGLNYYISAGYYDEEGLTYTGDEMFTRVNLDSKISAQATDWMKVSLLTKFMKKEDDFPWDYQYGEGRIFDLINKFKPTLPTHDPNGNLNMAASFPKWKDQREGTENNQVALLPRIAIEPVKDWIINLEYNYKRNNNKRTRTSVPTEFVRADGVIAYTPARGSSQVQSYMTTNEYYSPNLYTTYMKSWKDHNFDILLGYQSELYEYYNMDAKGLYLLSDNVLAINGTVGERTVKDAEGHWSTQSGFTRFKYNFAGKYMFEVSYRRDGSSKFESDSRWAGFPSFSAGYNIARENFWPLKDQIKVFKLRGSYGTLGNHNVPNYLYVPMMSQGQGNYLFDGAWGYTIGTPNLGSIGLSWDETQTLDLGFDLTALRERLTVNFDWYRADVLGMGAQGEKLPAVLGTSSPYINATDIRTQGWELDMTWKDRIEDFTYNVRVSVSDYKRTVLDHPNPTGLLGQHYKGKNMGDIWGLEWAGWFQDADDVANHPINQKWIYGSFTPGDTKYVDQLTVDTDGDGVPDAGDGKIDIGDNTIDNHGDLVVVGNTTPRYQYGVTLGMGWKGIDFNMFIQGVAKRDFNMGQTRYRGPAQGPFHGNVFTQHVDYWRDENSALGANPDAYYPKPYLQNPGKNNRNYKRTVDRYVVSAAYTRLKSLQIGYTFPKELSRKVAVERLRIYFSGENLFTVSELENYDPEVGSGHFGSGIAYPLSKVLSTGMNITF